MKEALSFLFYLDEARRAAIWVTRVEAGIAEVDARRGVIQVAHVEPGMGEVDAWRAAI